MKIEIKYSKHFDLLFHVLAYLKVDNASDCYNQEYIAEAWRTMQETYYSTINIPTVGASGAVFGILLAFGMMYPNTQLMLLIPPIPIKAKWLVIGYGAIELFLAFSQPGSNIAHFAHLGGMLFGFILIKYWIAQARRE
jgi:membrane associated rhomboid family serine protease